MLVHKFIGILPALVGGIYAAEHEYVASLTSSNFDDFIAKNDAVLVKFYASWCGHCQAMAPAYKAAAKTLAEKNHSAKFADVDAVAQSSLAERFSIKGYPTILFFRNGKHKNYSGDRDEATIVAWIESVTGPAVTVVTNKDDIKTVPNEAIYLLTTPSADSAEARAYSQAADVQRSLGKFYMVVDPSISETSLTVYHHGEDPRVTTTLEKMEEVIVNESLPLFSMIGYDNFKKYFDSGKDLLYYCGDASLFPKVSPMMRQVAQKYYKDYAFVFLDIQPFRSHAESHLDVFAYPAIVMHGNNGRFKMLGPDGKTQLKEDVTVDEVSKFITSVLNKDIKPSFKSEPIPTGSEDSRIKTVVGDNFVKEVLESHKNVLLSVVAPWCGHCKTWEAVLNQYSEKVKDDDSLIVAKMDGTANEVSVPNFSWMAFPTIYFLKAGSSEPRKYEGDRTVDALKAFVDLEKVPIASAGQTTPHEEL